MFRSPWHFNKIAKLFQIKKSVRSLSLDVWVIWQSKAIKTRVFTNWKYWVNHWETQAHHDKKSLTWRILYKNIVINDNEIERIFSPKMNLNSQIAAKNLKIWMNKLIHGVSIWLHPAPAFV